jgi:hypothetical protein
MKAILEFNLPEDDYDFRHCSKGTVYYHAIDDLRNHIRSLTKYGTTDQDIELGEKMLEVFNEIFGEVYYPE